jgi:hypothetical protein
MSAKDKREVEAIRAEVRKSWRDLRKQIILWPRSAS